MGKSIVGMQIAHCAAKAGHGAAFFSLEMTKDSLVRRLISSVGHVDAQRLRSGALNPEERPRALRAATDIEKLPLWIDDTRARTIPAVMAALRKLNARHEIRLVFVDHLQLMRCTGRAESRHQELSEISHSLKHLAAEFDVTVVLLSQLNRDCEREKRRPQLADLKETGSLEEDADVVLFIHRPEQYNRQDQSLRGQAEFIIGKQRNGPTGKLSMVFQHEYQRFVEATKQQEAEPAA
jgi:replicative DNA helicase